MKKLRKLAGLTVLLILVFMVIALFQYQSGEEISILPDRIEYYFVEGWHMAAFDDNVLPGRETNDFGRMNALIEKKLEREEYQEVNLPYQGKSGAHGAVVFQNTLPDDYAGLTMNFTSTGSFLCVILDGELIYQYEPVQEDLTGKLTGEHENFVDIPNVFQDGELWIVMSVSGQDIAPELGIVKIETRDMMIIGVMGSNIADIGCCLLILITAILMFVLALIRRYTHQPTRGEIFLGLTGLAAGIYCFIGTDTLSIFYDVQEAYEMQEYLVLLIPLFLTLYFERNFHMVFPRRFSFLIRCVTLNAAVQILLQRLGLRSLEKMANFTAAVLGVVCVVAIVSLLQYDYTKRYYLSLMSVVAILVLISGGIANVIMNTFFMSVRGNAAGQFSMAVFSTMMSVVHVFQISKEYRANAEEHADLLKEKVKAAQRQNTQLAIAKQEADVARQEAMAANEAKGKFLAHMSHEIRTPINAVLGMDEMILRESKEENIKAYAMDIRIAGQTLLSLINDILDFSKIDSGKMEIVPVEYDVSSMIHDLVNMASQRLGDKNVRLETEIDNEIPSRLYGDDVRIRQVLANILTNAVKYTHEGTVWFRIRGCRKNEMAVLQFEVEDTGIGIKEEDLPRLSAEFERIEEDRNHNIEGSGLGMNITMQLLKLLGSRLHVESIYGKGSKFSFELEQKIVDSAPIGDFKFRIQQIAEQYHYQAKLCAPDAKILVVDDNAVNRKVFRNLLKETKIQVTEAEGGLECLELVKENHYDLIFLDHMMPEMDGVETLHRFRALSGYPCQNTPVIVLTANAVSGAKEKYLAEGFDDFLSKPIVPEKLETMIRNMLPGELLQASETKKTQTNEEEPGVRQQAGQLPAELPFVDGLDWQYAWLHLPDLELLEYTIKEFYAQIDPAADQLEQAYGKILEPGWLDRYRIQVHAMKSLAATAGIIPLSGVAKLLEYAARDGKIEMIMSMTEPFLEEWRGYCQKLQGVFGIGAEEKKQVTDRSVIQALLEMLRLSMQEMDIDQSDQLMGQLRAYEYPEAAEQNIRKLAGAVTNLDVEEANRLVDLLAVQIGLTGTQKFESKLSSD